jgi:hypothetical protein
MISKKTKCLFAILLILNQLKAYSSQSISNGNIPNTNESTSHLIFDKQSFKFKKPAA